ncbi:hypothetical protein H072_7642 [Dactylellina haptotyla CBS 200.50]|uniref:Uncharacterized protein n=1 Tax=Dactylellina haptotyla (strain CBS 200.50) TaxID=1284197 RepID=S8ABZ5_DACHA|nr:hypothetical protein H072_7642 [Dactylellina haptotyla CBS 200.50]
MERISRVQMIKARRFYYVAEFASPETIDVLASLRLNILCIVGKKTRKSQTAIDIVEKTWDPNRMEVSAAYGRLLRSIKIAAIDEELDEGEVFYEVNENEILASSVA